ncbi:response regulator transcription factor [Nocardioides aurantiacus]|uniref:response regulator transcription factor n=1 Tax=Nocardioides aurantiacus TaxID=86796 RepID=UPI00403F4005
MTTTTPEPTATVAPPVRVLVVDDDPELRALYQHALGSTDGFEVVAQAVDGLDGVAAARRHAPDLVLLDLMMPVMDGLVALPLIRDASPGSRVVVVSSLPPGGVAAAALAAGADAFVPKGQPLGALVSQVRDVARR